jgi:hypothetical protein
MISMSVEWQPEENGGKRRIREPWPESRDKNTPVLWLKPGDLHNETEVYNGYMGRVMNLQH